MIETAELDDLGVLVVHTKGGVIRIRLTGDVRLDSLLLRLARRGGCVVQGGALAGEVSS